MSPASLDQYRRVRNVALAGLCLLAIVCGLSLILGFAFGSAALQIAGLLTACPTLAWAALTLVHWQHVLEREEDAEAELLRQQRASESIFADTDVSLRTHRRRLESMHRLLLPATSLILAAAWIGLGVIGLSSLARWPLADAAWPVPQNALALAAVAGLVFGFGLFLFSRYASGLARTPGGSLIRSGTGAMFLASLAFAAAAAGLAFAHYRNFQIEQAVALVLPWVMIVLGVEALLGFIVDLYRPRTGKLVQRATFESRLLNLVSEPQAIAASFADALNYQFGFELSKTWFYQLIRRAIGPLVAFQILTLWLLSCLVIVPEGSVAVVERTGRPRGSSPDGSLDGVRQSLLQSGLHFKLPWPFEQVREVNTESLQLLTLGFSERELTDEDRQKAAEVRAIVWTESVHGLTPEVDWITAVRDDSILRGADEKTRSEYVPVGMVRARIDVHYRITDPVAYLYHYADPDEVLNAMVYRAVTHFFARNDVDGLLSADRFALIRELTEAINDSMLTVLPADRSLGVEVVYVGVFDLHPPFEVAAEYEKVIIAEQDARTAANNARTDAERILSTIAGSQRVSGEVAGLIGQYEAAVKSGDPPEQTDAMLATIHDKLMRLDGRVSTILADAIRQRWRSELSRRAQASALLRQLPVYQASPAVFMRDQLHLALERGLAQRRKLVLLVDPARVNILSNLREPANIGQFSSPGDE